MPVSVYVIKDYSIGYSPCSGETSKAGDAVSMPKDWQWSGAYPGVDDWTNVILKNNLNISTYIYLLKNLLY